MKSYMSVLSMDLKQVTRVARFRASVSVYRLGIILVLVAPTLMTSNLIGEEYFGEQRRRELSEQELAQIAQAAFALQARYEANGGPVKGSSMYPEWRFELPWLPIAVIDSNCRSLDKEKAVAISLKFLEENAQILGLERFTFRQQRVLEHKEKGKVYSKSTLCRLRVDHKGVEVYGSNVSLTFADSFLVRVELSVERDSLPEVEPHVSKDSAASLASHLATMKEDDLRPAIARHDKLFGDPAKTAADVSVTESRLLIYSPRIFGQAGHPRLMWQLQLSAHSMDSLGASGTYFIDAHTGEFLWRSSGRIN